MPEPNTSGQTVLRSTLTASSLTLLLATPAFAGPPYVTDDPDPTETGHYEVYAFAAGTRTASGIDGAAGLDVSYGAIPDLQLSLTVPIAYEHPDGGPLIGGVGNIEIAAKYRILHQDDVGVDVAVFPRVFLPSVSSRVGDRHASLFLPVWIGRHMDKWTTFGGGGCAINNGGGSRNYCLAGWALTYRVRADLELGAEIYHQTPDAVGARHTTGLNFGARYDVSENFHLVGSIGPGIQNADETNQVSAFAALLFTF